MLVSWFCGIHTDLLSCGLGSRSSDSVWAWELLGSDLHVIHPTVFFPYFHFSSISSEQKMSILIDSLITWTFTDSIVSYLLLWNSPRSSHDKYYGTVVTCSCFLWDVVNNEADSPSSRDLLTSNLLLLVHILGKDNINNILITEGFSQNMFLQVCHQ